MKDAIFLGSFVIGVLCTAFYICKLKISHQLDDGSRLDLRAGKVLAQWALGWAAFGVLIQVADKGFDF